MSDELTRETQLFVCGARFTYRADSRGWWKYDYWLRKFTRGRRG